MTACFVTMVCFRDDVCCIVFFFFFKQKTAYEMRISDWSSDVCSSDLIDLTTPETVDRPIVDVDMEPGERSRSFAHDAAERHALPTEPEHLRQRGQQRHAGEVGAPLPQSGFGEAGDALVAGRSALAGGSVGRR